QELSTSQHDRRSIAAPFSASSKKSFTDHYSIRKSFVIPPSALHNFPKQDSSRNHNNVKKKFEGSPSTTIFEISRMTTPTHKIPSRKTISLMEEGSAVPYSVHLNRATMRPNLSTTEQSGSHGIENLQRYCESLVEPMKNLNLRRLSRKTISITGLPTSEIDVTTTKQPEALKHTDTLLRDVSLERKEITPPVDKLRSSQRETEDSLIGSGERMNAGDQPLSRLTSDNADGPSGASVDATTSNLMRNVNNTSPKTIEDILALAISIPLPPSPPTTEKDTI
ncbi:8091_t:CDS:2, partial [Acaulospora morrowiae]